MDEELQVRSVLKQYGIDNYQSEQILSGLINRTWLITRQQSQFILQRVNPIFPVEIHHDIEAITSQLSKAGTLTPRLIATKVGKLFYENNNDVWRLYSYLEGVTYNNITHPKIAYEAGSLLGIFHRALEDTDYQFTSSRPGVHDTSLHLRNLKTALANKQEHSHFKNILPLATEILQYASQLPELPKTDTRMVHGDPKINNFLFDKITGNGICLLDFDTFSDMQLPLELGDAMRSWCNPEGEDTAETSFSLEILSAGLEGYAMKSGNLLSVDEWNAIVPATQIIYIELAARFCADALNENYFSWDPKSFSSHSEHSHIRALSQLTAYKSLIENLTESNQIVTRIFS
ncbi:MAG: Ser/Thr protein kinase RdoA (MazF antagonist) [Gammaproteobacteria bacterium]|jgi:Ser/Thr protein kinase RdoA (MazF antagonist)